MKTAQKVWVIILSVTFVISAVALGLSYFAPAGILPGSGFRGESVENIMPQSLVTEYPLVQSDIDNIFYCISPDGTVEFYEFGKDMLSKYSGEVNSVDLKPLLTYYAVPITVYYIEVDGKTIGYGLFTTENTRAEVNLYSYAFAKLTDAPTVYGVDGKMLLISTNPDEVYSADKIYTEAFSVDMDTQKCSPITAQRDRNADKTGRLSERWSMFTDSYLASVSKKAGMISGRLYNEGTAVFDAYDLNESLNTPEIKGMWGTYLRETENGALVYIKKTDDGFKSVEFIAEEKELAFIKSKAEGEKNLVFSGDWVYDLKAEKFTSLLTGKTVEGKKLDEGIADFCANADGSKIAVALSDGDSHTLAVVSADGKVKNYACDKAYSDMLFINSGTLVATAPANDGTWVNYIITVQ